jgi:SAM-dependent methyltransferase
MTDLFSLGRLYVSDFLRPDEQPRAEPVELKLVFDDATRRVHLAESADAEFMYGRYWYRSGTNATMTNELAGIVTSITDAITVERGDLWVDIACNDGTLLAHVPEAMVRAGVDPADDTFASESRRNADLILQEPFTYEGWKNSELGNLRAKVVTCIAMFYDLEDPMPFLRDVVDLMRDDGLFVVQMSYTPLMLRQMAFDNICHEHIHYYTLSTLSTLFRSAGLHIVDVQLNDVNGGSFRVYAMKHGGDETMFATQPYRDVCNMRVAALEAMEFVHDVNSPEVWYDFRARVETLKTDVVEFIHGVRRKGQSVWAYGASTKGNTLLQYFGLDHTMIDGIAERSQYKFGLRTVGTNIPIVSEDEMRAANPDYLLVLPWHFISEFVKRERAYLEGGGQFIVPCPEFRVIGA